VAGTNLKAGSGGAGASRPVRLALITLGQTPRTSIVADLVAALPPYVSVTEFGALDGLDSAAVAERRPKAHEASVATRLRDGRQVLVSRASAHAGIQAILSSWSADRFDLAVILATGSFDAFPRFSSPARLIQPQPAMDNAVSVLVRAGHKVAVIQPYARHVGEDVLGLSAYQRQVSWLDVDNEQDWARVVAACAGCQAVVLNSVDYDEDAAIRLGAQTGLPVILPRRVLASAIRFVLETSQEPWIVTSASTPAATLLQRLTPRERQVMWLMVDGLQTKQIGRRLDISPRTVSIHRANVLAKLEVPNATALTRLMFTGSAPGEQWSGAAG
jgi:DNA-binding NarL/FixJ family response regulator